jgi:hypothetical protein
MLSLMQKLKIAGAQRLLASAGIKSWFDLRVIHDSKKNLFGAQMGAGTLDELLPKMEARRVALRPDCRLELRMYATLVNKRGVFMGQEIPEPPTVVVGTAPPFDRWNKASAFKPKARAAGVVLEAKGEPPVKPPETDDALLRAASMLAEPGRIMSEDESVAAVARLLDTPIIHACNKDGPRKQFLPDQPFLPTCSICGDSQP